MQVSFSSGFKQEVNTFDLNIWQCLYLRFPFSRFDLTSLPADFPWIKIDRNPCSISIIPPFVGEPWPFGRKLLSKVPAIKGGVVYSFNSVKVPATRRVSQFHVHLPSPFKINSDLEESLMLCCFYRFPSYSRVLAGLLDSVCYYVHCKEEALKGTHFFWK